MTKAEKKKLAVCEKPTPTAAAVTPSPMHIRLSDRERFFRRPRSKKRRIIAKWRKNRANWCPCIPRTYSFILGSRACINPAAAAATLALARRTVEMHPAHWEIFKEKYPEVAARCTVVNVMPDPFEHLR
jgi:hypothetical protein